MHGIRRLLEFFLGERERQDKTGRERFILVMWSGQPVHFFVLCLCYYSFPASHPQETAYGRTDTDRACMHVVF